MKLNSSLGEERANLSVFRMFDRFVLVWICRFPLPLDVWEGLRFVQPNKPIRNTILNFNKLVSDLDIETSSPDSWDCKDSKFCYQPASHIVTGNLKIITDSRIRSVISKGPKYRFPAHIDFNKCRETIASALNDYCTRWCKREHVESNALNNWKLKIFKIIDERVLFYSNNLDLLPPKPKLSFRYLKQGIQEFHRKYVLAPADKAANNIVVV